MADKKISELTAATTVNDGDQLPLVQSGSTLSLDASVLRAYVTADSTLVKVDSVQTLTHKTISGASNTLSNIGNSSLSNSSITIGSTAVSLGGTISTLVGIADSTTNGGHYSKGAFSGAYTDGIVLDYTTGTGRISVGSSDGLSIYNGGVGGTALLNLDSAGNLGLGVTPSAWSGTNPVVEFIGSGFIGAGDGATLNIGENAYNNAGWRYKNTAPATLHTQYNGTYIWRTAPSGTAGSAISFTQAMTLFASGCLAVGGTTDLGAGVLNVGSGTSQTAISGRNISFYNTSVADATIKCSDDTSTFTSAALNKTQWAWYTNNTEKMRLTSAGYLGIGTSSPGSMLTLGSLGAIRVQTGATYWTLTPTAGATDQLRFNSSAAAYYTWDQAGTQAMVLDPSGNLGLGVTPSGWNLGKSIELSAYGNALWSGGINDCRLLANAYYNSGFKYGNTSTASMLEMSGGNFLFFTAPSGTAGNAISFTQAMTLDASGNLLVGKTSGTGYRIEPYGPGIYLSGSGGYAGYLGQANIFMSSGAGTDFAIRSDANLLFSAGGNTERARIDTSGNLGLGVTPSAWVSPALPAFDIGTTGGIAGQTNAANLHVTANAYLGSGPAWKYKTSNFAGRFTVGNDAGTGGFSWFTAPSGTAGTAISFTQAMTLNAAGNQLIGTTTDYGGRVSVVPATTPTTIAGGNQIQVGESSSNTGYRLQVGYINDPTNGFMGSIQSYGGGSPNNLILNGAGGNLLMGTITPSTTPVQGITAYSGSSSSVIGVGHASGSASGNGYVLFAYNGTLIGSITQNGTTGVLYNITSDQRLKTNVQPAGSAIQSILDFPVDQFDWISTGEHQDFGGVAQKVLPIIPEMVSVPADEEEMMGIDWSKAVPRLIRAYQELHAELQALKATLH